MLPWNPARTKVQIKLSIQRLRTLQEKKLALAKKARRDIADLVQKGRIENAKLRVEGLIQDDIYVELLELLELYAETLQARFGLLDAASGETPEPSVADAVCAIIYAAPRTELKELQVLREILMHKYGRAFSLSLQPSDPPPAVVPQRIVSKLVLYTPPAALVDAYLGEIARGYGVSYLPPLEDGVADAALEPEKDDGGEGSGGSGDGEGSGSGAAGGDDDDDDVGGVKEPAKAVAIAIPIPDEKSPSVRAPVPSPRTTGPTVVKKHTEDDDLAARFERLKNLK
ncbi:uncharacterized protein EHS24_000190 [Apiotrichum porosum]|uniref:Vacuolar protein sorting-associated protein ist1 n=1 Tax=Apiotrichum porosum TaxID=105984 RepID=A0A427Y9B2_9TREE|nr:uncharacterized protein EHS24_000190 [Apiotrichum porosum]RSH87676.1 hypothetical protein EHS24_000190 [Apiotrichum porosum]